MYKLLLILKYLRRKLAPMFAAFAVTLCTAMVIIVMSVMGGFLDQMRDTAKRLTADVIIGSDLGGFPHYDQIVDEIRKLPSVKTATPIIKAYGLANFSDGVHQIEVQGVHVDELQLVVGFKDSLYWEPPDIQQQVQRMLPHEQRQAEENLRDLPDIVMGIEVSPANVRGSDGEYDPLFSTLGQKVTLTVLPLTQKGTLLDPAVRNFVVTNEFKSGYYEIDAKRVYVPFEQLQQMLGMDEAKQADPQTLEPTGRMIPARASEIFVRGYDGVDLLQLRAAVDQVALSVIRQYPNMPRMWSYTWEEAHSTLLGAVQNEKGLVTFLFVIISVVAIVMVATTFYMIVLEKTRDIGVLRALGASRWGIANIFLGYGLAIGVVGSLVGLGLAYAIVTHLNEIQELLYQWFGWRMWDPAIYVFDRIPDRVNPVEATFIVVGSMASSVIGALIPALLAGRLNPVEALRYE